MVDFYFKYKQSVLLPLSTCWYKIESDLTYSLMDNTAFYLIYLEKWVSWSSWFWAILDLSLFRQIICVIDWRLHFTSCQKRCQVGRIGGNHNKREKPPDTCNRSCWYCPVILCTTHRITICNSYSTDIDKSNLEMLWNIEVKNMFEINRA